MLNSLINQARSTNLRTMKSMTVAIWGTALVLILFLAFVLAALGNIVGLHGGEIAWDFLVAAAGPGLLVPTKFSLILFFLVALHFGFCWDSTRIPALNLIDRLSSLLAESIKLWSSTAVSNYVPHYGSPNDPNRRSPPNKRTAIEGTSYLACDTPKLE